MQRIHPKFYNDENDVYWKMMVENVNKDGETKPNAVSYRAFYESFLYEKVLLTKGWSWGILEKFSQDEVFLSRHIEVKNIMGYTALLYAVYINNEDIVRTLLNSGADVEAQNSNTHTPLILATIQGNTNMVRLLLSFNCNLNRRIAYDNTALIWASACAPLEIIQILLDAGADKNIKNISGNTAADVAYNLETAHLLTQS
jgi:ankyrin repeat protein